MSSPLHPGWLPDRELFAESTDWITARLPWPLRVAPLVGTFLLVILLASTWFINVPVDGPTSGGTVIVADQGESHPTPTSENRERLAVVLWQRLHRGRTSP